MDTNDQTFRRTNPLIPEQHGLKHHNNPSGPTALIAGLLSSAFYLWGISIILSTNYATVWVTLLIIVGALLGLVAVVFGLISLQSFIKKDPRNVWVFGGVIGGVIGLGVLLALVFNWAF